MKKILLICLMALTSISADEYLISADDMGKSGGYGGFSFQNMKINGKTTTLTGGRGTWVIGDKYHIGFGGYSDASNDNDNYNDNVYKRNGFSYGFLSLGWSSGAPTIYNPYAFLSLGFGNMNDKLIRNTQSMFSAIGLSAGVQLKITKWFRLVPFIGYTYINFNNNNYYKNSDFGGLNYGLQFNFGSWRK